MGRSDENSFGFVGETRLHDRKIKSTATTGPTRIALSTIDKNIITEDSSRPNAANKRPLSERSDVNCFKAPPHRPVTRKFAAQLADQKQQTYEKVHSTVTSDSVPSEAPERIIIDVDDSDNEETKPPDTVSRKEPESIIIDIDDSDEEKEGDFNEPMFVQHTEAMLNDFNEPMFVQHTEPMLNEIDQMEIEMEDEDEEEMEDEDQEEETAIDIDACDQNNPLAVVDYIDEIHAMYKKFEKHSCVPHNYMDNQKDLNERMRAILIDWLIEVHYKFELMEETLYLTVNLIDRFLAVHQISRKKLQLVGVTALLIACKYEEVSVPVVDDLILISDKAYTRTEVLEMEKLMANTLQFKFSFPTPYVFMKRFLKAAQSDKKLAVLSFFMIELCLVEYEMLEYLPSKLAASAVYTALCTLKGFEEWSITCEFHTGYMEDQLLVCARKMVAFHKKAGTGKLTGVHRKYNTSKFCHVARTEPAGFLLLEE